LASRRTVSDVDTFVYKIGTVDISMHLRSAASGQAPNGVVGDPDNKIPPFSCCPVIRS
jgi:hypothetical protein